MAVRNTLKHDQTTIERIRATIQSGQLIKRLMQHGNGEVEMSPTQIRACEILLRKSVPDLQAITLTGNDGGPITISWEK